MSEWADGKQAMRQEASNLWPLKPQGWLAAGDDNLNLKKSLITSEYFVVKRGGNRKNVKNGSSS